MVEVSWGVKMSGIPIDYIICVNDAANRDTTKYHQKKKLCWQFLRKSKNCLGQKKIVRTGLSLFWNLFLWLIFTVPHISIFMADCPYFLKTPPYAEWLFQFLPSFIVPGPHKSLIVAIYCSMLGCVLWPLIFMSLYAGGRPQPQQNISSIATHACGVCMCMCLCDGTLQHYCRFCHHHHQSICIHSPRGCIQ